MGRRVQPRALLLDHGSCRQGAEMFFVSEAEAIAIHAPRSIVGASSRPRSSYAAVPAMTDNAQAR